MNINIPRYLLLSVAVVVAFFAVKYSLANLAYLKVDRYLVRWQETQLPTSEELDDAFSASKTMLMLHGHHPHYLNMAAKLYEWSAFKFQDNSEMVDDSLKKALSLYQRSTEKRSHWPLTWAYMADVKAKMGQLDDDFYLYVDNAIKFGPYTKEVNLQIAKLFLTFWGQKSELPMKLGLEQIKRSLQNPASAKTLLDYAQSTNKQAIVCTVAKLNKLGFAMNSRVCQQAG